MIRDEQKIRAFSNILNNFLKRFSRFLEDVEENDLDFDLKIKIFCHENAVFICKFLDIKMKEQ